MCTSCTADATTKNGMLIYDTGSLSGGCDNSSGFTIDTNSNDIFYGAGVSSSNLTGAPAAPYYGILFFEDRNACAQTHTLGKGNGCFSIIGTVYATNTLAIMTATPAQYQSVLLPRHPLHWRKELWRDYRKSAHYERKLRCHYGPFSDG